MITITTLEEIKVRGPCPPGWEKLIKILGRTTGRVTFKQILSSNGIQDAVWCLCVLPYKDRHLFKTDVAESVLPLFQKRHTEDSRPRKVIESIRRFYKIEITKYQLDEYRRDDGADGAAERKLKWLEIEKIFIKYFIEEDK
jgi:hypothetical protein